MSTLRQSGKACNQRHRRKTTGRPRSRSWSHSQPFSPLWYRVTGNCCNIRAPFLFTLHRIPMTISMYQASVPRFANVLGNLSNILDKAQAHVDAKKLDAATLTNFRLFPDMFPLARQVQIACDTAKGLVARLAGVEIPAYEDNEVTIADLKARIAKTIAFMQSIPAEKIDGTEDKDIVTKRGDKETHYKGMQFLLGHAVPNVYFHVTTAYNILRHNGVEIGKRDYLGNP